MSRAGGVSETSAVAPRLARGPARRAALILELRRRATPGGVGIGVGVDDLAAAVGLHPNTAREHLDVLVAEGLVERLPGPRAGRGRPRALYAAVPSPGAAAMPATFTATGAEAHDLRDRVLRIVLSHYGTGPEEAAAAVEREGSRWGEDLGRAAGPVDGVTQMVGLVAQELESMGMEPRLLEDVRDAGDRGAPAGAVHVEIGACPLATLAHDRPDVVCGVHAAMLRGLARGASASGVDVRLLPFEGPLMCRVEVAAS
jgi:predicted ArsR family transcriptional regulator